MIRHACFCGLLLALAFDGVAGTVTVTHADGEPLARVMVTAQRPDARHQEVDPAMGEPSSARSLPQYTVFTAADGRASVDAFTDGRVIYRLRHPGYADREIGPVAADAPVTATMERITSPMALARSRPANTWASRIRWPDEATRKHFKLQCGFCHQQGAPAIRQPRSEEQWRDVIERMVGYGARLASDVREIAPAILSNGYERLRNNPELVPEGTPWRAHLSGARVTEWPIGDALSQMHDMMVHSNGKVYIGDNLKDDLYELDPDTGAYTVYKLPRDADDELGGLISARLQDFPSHESYVGLHSLAESPRDGHIFMTASVQRRIIEFAPESGEFMVHRMDDGLYPHTIRVDGKDRVWFTLALSNQVAMLDRDSGTFTYYDLPTRSIKEWITVQLVRPIMEVASWGVPLSALPVDRQSSGLPLPYGIDVAPDGRVWFARLHTDEIGVIDPSSQQLRMIETPFMGPRRLRVDADNNVWIAAFPESAIVRYDPHADEFTRYPLPTEPEGSDSPYALNVDRDRNLVWVNGTASDTMLRFNPESEKWRVFPMPRRRTFTREVDFAPDGTVYTSSASFPSWDIEGAQPTLIRLEPQGVR